MNENNEPSEALILLWLTLFIICVILIKIIFFATDTPNELLFIN